MANHQNGALSNGQPGAHPSQRSNSISQASESSQTAQEYIRSQLQLEQDAREALPYQFDTCTKALGALRQTVFSCLTCNPPPSNPTATYSPAGVCYSCSISCHGEHDLVELFARRSFECDCGTTRLPAASLCSLRLHADTGLKGGVHSEKPATSNTYNHNYKNRFCGCGEIYDPHTEKGTMFQCLGLASEAEGGCGEDWWHPECLLGLPRDAHVAKKPDSASKPEDVTSLPKTEEGQPPTVDGTPTADETQADEVDAQDDDPPLPPGFPAEDSFEHLICYKCADSVPWIKAYAGAPGFLPAVLHASSTGPEPTASTNMASTDALDSSESKKRKADGDDALFAPPPKKQSMAAESATTATTASSRETSAPTPSNCTYPAPPPSALFKASLFMTADFRSDLCRCPTHFPLLSPLPFLLDEEETYEPPISEGSDAAGNGTHDSEGSRSLYDRGEAALSAVDRVRAIEGVMAYNHLRDKVKGFLKPFAESGKPVGAEDVKAYFEKLRGDDLAMKQAQAGQSSNKDGDGAKGEGDGRKEQDGY